MKFGVLVLILTLGIAVLRPMSNAHAGGPADDGVVYNGAFETVTQTIGTTLVGAGGGTISITLTSDRSGVTHIATREFIYGTDADHIYHFGQDAYFAPPLPIVNGSVSAQPPIILDRKSYSTLNVEIHIESDTQLNGTGQIVGAVTSLVAPFTATGPVEPRPVGALYTARVEGQDGTISIALDASQGVQSYTLHNVVLLPCVTAPQTLPVLFDSPDSIEDTSRAWVSLGDYGLYRMWFNGQRNGDSFSGTLSIFPGDCSTDVHWTTAAAESETPNAMPTVTAVPTAAVALPGTGSAHDDPGRLTRSIALLAIAGAALTLLAAIARRAR